MIMAALLASCAGSSDFTRLGSDLASPLPIEPAPVIDEPQISYTPAPVPTLVPTVTPTVIPTVVPTPGPTGCQCPSGYLFDVALNKCKKVIQESPVNGQGKLMALKVGGYIYQSTGMKLTESKLTKNYPIDFTGVFKDSLGNNVPTVYQSTMMPWNQNRLNDIGMVFANEADHVYGKTYTVGFCIDNQSSGNKDYFMGIAADNAVAMSVSGLEVYKSGWVAPSIFESFQNWQILQINVPSGKTHIAFKFMNRESVYAFAYELYENSLSQIQSAASISDLNVITNSKMAIQAGLRTIEEGTQCATGYEYDACKNICTKIEVAACMN